MTASTQKGVDEIRAYAAARRKRIWVAAKSGAMLYPRINPAGIGPRAAAEDGFAIGNVDPVHAAETRVADGKLAAHQRPLCDFARPAACACIASFTRSAARFGVVAKTPSGQPLLIEVLRSVHRITDDELPEPVYTMALGSTRVRVPPGPIALLQAKGANVADLAQTGRQDARERLLAVLAMRF